MAKMSYEIRILAGLHAGARLPAMETMTIGSDEECAIVLNDPGLAPIAAEVELGQGQWSVKLADKKYSLHLSYGEVFWIGVVPITIALKAMPWPVDIPSPLETKQYDDDLDQDETDLEKTDIDDDLDGDTEDEDGKDDSLSQKNKKDAETGNNPAETETEESKATNKKPWKIIISIAVALLLVLIIGAGTIMMQSEEKINQQEKISEEVNQHLQEIELSLEEEVKEDKLAINKTSNNKIIISGYVTDRGRVHNIERKIENWSPFIILKLFVIDEIKESVNEILHDYFHSIHLKDVTHDGVVHLEGFASDRNLVKLIATLKSDVIGISSIDTKHVKKPSDIAQQFQEEVIERGLTNLNLRYSSGHIYASGKLTTSDMKIWDHLLRQVNTKYKNMISVSANITEFPDIPQEKKVVKITKEHSHVTYKTAKDYGAYGIYGVINGANKYIITENGGRVMIGGRIGEFRLAAISDNEIVLDGPQRLILQR